MNVRTAAALAELRDALVAEYRLTIAGRGIAEAELASQRTPAAAASVRHWLAKVRVMEEARETLKSLTRTLEISI